MNNKKRHKKSKHNVRQSLPGKKHSENARLKDYWPWFVLFIVIIFTVAIRIRLLEIPLERDEGEFAYMGQLILQGIPPYLIAYNMKLPGIYAIYALIMALFGETITGIHLGLILANSVAIILLFILTRYLFNNAAAIVAAISYALLSLSPQVLGTSAHATQFIVPFAIGGTILLLKAIDSQKLVLFFVSGLLFGIAFTLKQHAAFFIAFAFFYYTLKTLTAKPLNWKRLIAGNTLLALGSALPFLIICVILYRAGVFSMFWFWAFHYASQYASIVPLSMGFESFRHGIIDVTGSWAFLWIIAAIGLTAIFWYDKAKQHKYFLLGFFIFSFLTVFPGFYFRRHYFITFLPAIAMASGIALTASIKWLYQKKVIPLVQIIPVFIITATIIYPVIKTGDFFFMLPPAEACRLMYGINPFPESIKIAKYIKEKTTENDRIAVIGSEPQIYFYANRKSATGYIYTYGLMEPHSYASKMQLEMIREIETAQPKYAVVVIVPTSWLPRDDSDKTILKWSETYFNQNYTTVGLLSSTINESYKIYWDEEARNNKPLSPNYLLVMERSINQNIKSQPKHK
jgi:hypothetical protein